MHPFDLIIGILIGAAVTGGSTVVYNFVKKEEGYAEADAKAALPTAAAKK